MYIYIYNTVQYNTIQYKTTQYQHIDVYVEVHVFSFCAQVCGEAGGVPRFEGEAGEEAVGVGGGDEGEAKGAQKFYQCHLAETGGGVGMGWMGG